MAAPRQTAHTPDLAIAISLFAAPATTNTQPVRRDISWSELVKLLSTHERRRDKDGRGWSPATFRPGTLRANNHVDALSCFVADLDHHTLDDVSAIKERLRAFGLTFIVHSTYSCTEDDVRFRAIVPLARPVDANGWPALWQHVNRDIFDGRCDPGTKDPGRFYFLPAAPPGALIFADSASGAALDMDIAPSHKHHPAGGRLLKYIKLAEPIGERIAPGTRHNTLLSLAGSMRRRGAGLEAIRAALHAENVAKCVPPLGDSEVDFLVADVDRRYGPVDDAAAPEWGPPSAVPKMAKTPQDGQPPGVDHLRQSWPSSPVRVRLSEVRPERVEWVWRGRVALRKLAVLDGDPDLGKSTITLDLAARVSTGRAMPDGTASDLGGPAGVLILSAEDGLADTIRPRLDAAGADVERIVALQAAPDVLNGSRPLTIPDDLAVVEEEITREQVRLVIVDPLMAYLGAGTNTHRDQDVRRALAPFAAVAERTGAAVLVIRHLNKSGGANPLYRGGGAIGIIGAARFGLLVAPDPDDPTGERRIFAVAKANLARKLPALAYRIETVAVAGVEDPVARIAWHGPTEHTARALLSVAEDHEEGGPGGALDEAREFLRTVLGGGPKSSSEVLSEAAAAGIAEKTLRRAQKSVGVRAGKLGFRGPWAWRLERAAEQGESARGASSTAPI